MKCLMCRKTVNRNFKYCPYCGTLLPSIPDTEPRYKRNHAARGQGYIYKRGNTWSVRVRKSVYPPIDPLTGQQPKPIITERTKGGFSTRQAAAAYASQLSFKPVQERKLTLAYYWSVFEKDELPSLAYSRRQGYSVAYSRLQPIANIPITDISVQDIRNLMSSLNLTFNPASDIKIVLTKLYKMAYADDQSVRLDIPKMVILPPKEEKERDAFTPEEIFRIYALYTSGSHMAALILVMIYTSMMPGELLHLTPDMIDIKNQRILHAGLKTKSRKKAVIAFPSFLSPILQQLVSQCHDNSKPVCQITSYSTFKRHYYQTLQQANVRPLVPYSCRHTTQTVLALDPTISQAQRAAAMRHSIQMEDRYTHVQESQAHQAIQKMPSPDSLLQNQKG